MRNPSLILIAGLVLAPATPGAAQIADRVGTTERARISVGPLVVEVRRDDRDRRRDECYDARGTRSRRAGSHDWYDAWGRYDCTYRDDRVRVVNRGRNGIALARAHAAMIDQLDREHERWHRSHGWNPRNRGWERSHAALHARLDREHERWHRSSGATWDFWPDAGWRYDVSGRGVGVTRW